MLCPVAMPLAPKVWMTFGMNRINMTIHIQEMIMSLQRLPSGNYPSETEALVDVGIKMSDEQGVGEAARFLSSNEIPVKVINRVLFEPWLRRRSGRTA